MQPTARRTAPGRGLSDGDQILLLGSRLELTPEEQARMRALLSREGFQWPMVVDQAVRHGVAPLLSRTVEALSDDVQQSDALRSARSRLAELRAVSRSRSLRLGLEVATIVSALSELGVSVIALKDISLSAEIYPEPGLRPLGDLDLLILEQDYVVASRALTALGFAPRPSHRTPFLRRYGSGQHFVRQSDAVWVDLQWNVAERAWDRFADGRGSYRIDNIWAAARSIPFCDVELMVPSHEEMLLHLCLHLEGHEYGELILLTDIAELLRSRGSEIDWEVFQAAVRREHAQSAVSETLGMVRLLFGLDVPVDTLDSSPYSTADLTRPLFKNLAQLHHAVDEIDRRASPPPDALRRFSQITRRQALRATRAFTELDELATAVAGLTGRYVAFAGRRPARVLPDTTLPAFFPIRLLAVGASDRCFEEALRCCGFSELADGSWIKTVELSSADPLLANDRACLELHVTFVDGSLAIEAAEPAVSKAQAALKSLRSMSGRPPGDSTARIEVRMAALTDSEAALWAAREMAASGHDRLFRLRSLLMAVGDGGHAATALERIDATRFTGSTMCALTAALALRGEDVPGPVPWRDGAPAPLPLFVAARPLESGVSSPFRSPYYWALSFSAIDSWRARFRYGASRVWSRGSSPLAGVLADMGSYLQRRWRRRSVSDRPLAYWADEVAQGRSDQA